MLNVGASSFLKPVHVPERAFMERRWQRQQRPADEVKEKPDDENSQRALDGAPHAREHGAFEQRHAGMFGQTRGTDHPALVFGDTLAAEKAETLRTAGHGFARRVMKATLKRQGRRR